MSSFLDKHLDDIYITENLEKSFSLIKSKSAAIIKGMSEGNLFKVRKLLNTLPDTSLEQLMQIANRGKNFNKYNLEAKRKVRGDQTEMQKVFILTYASLKGIQQTSKDMTLVQAIDKILIALSEFADKYGSKFMTEGFTLALMMVLISFFFGQLPIIGELLRLGAVVGATLFWFGLLLLVIRLILNTYFSLKGIK
jgi:hypothetical protein